MTPLDFAQRLAQGDPEDQALGVAIVTRGLTDDDGLRQGWPLDHATVSRAASLLGLDPTPGLIHRALEIAPTVSDAMLNRTPR